MTYPLVVEAAIGTQMNRLDRRTIPVMMIPIGWSEKLLPLHNQSWSRIIGCNPVWTMSNRIYPMR